MKRSETIQKKAATKQLISEAKMLIGLRRAYNKAVKEDRADDKAAYAREVEIHEKWFQENHPKLNIATISSLNKILKEAERGPDVAITPTKERKNRKVMHEVSAIPKSEDDGSTTNSETRKRPATVRRHPAMRAKA